MDVRHITDSNAISFANEPQVKRTRSILLIMAGICLGICVAYAIISIYDCAAECHAGVNKPGAKIALAFISILFYGFGIIVAYRYYQIGLRVFAWLGVISLIVTGLTLLPIDVDFFPSSSVIKGAGVHDGMDIAVIVGISIILCIMIFVLTIIVVCLTFKLARLLNVNQHSTVQAI